MRISNSYPSEYICFHVVLASSSGNWALSRSILWGGSLIFLLKNGLDMKCIIPRSSKKIEVIFEGFHSIGSFYSSFVYLFIF